MQFKLLPRLKTSRYNGLFQRSRERKDAMILSACARNNEAPSERILLILGTELGSVLVFFACRLFAVAAEPFPFPRPSFM